MTQESQEATQEVKEQSATGPARTTAPPHAADQCGPGPDSSGQSEIGAGPEPERMAPVSEAIRYRRRAQAAERRSAELERAVAAEQAARAELAGELSAARRRAELTMLLAKAGAIDLDAAVVLAEQRLAGNPPGAVGRPAELAGVVEQMLKDKPYLLGGRGDAPGAGPGSPQAVTMTTPTQGRRGPAVSVELLRSAARQAGSGRPADMDRYLKLRRQFR